jgi:hypothetical protein
MQTRLQLLLLFSIVLCLVAPLSASSAWLGDGMLLACRFGRSLYAPSKWFRVAPEIRLGMLHDEVRQAASCGHPLLSSEVLYCVVLCCWDQPRFVPPPLTHTRSLCCLQLCIFAQDKGFRKRAVKSGNELMVPAICPRVSHEFHTSVHITIFGGRCFLHLSTCMSSTSCYGRVLLCASLVCLM